MKPTDPLLLDTLISLASRGSPADWGLIDLYLKDNNITPELLYWAKYKAKLDKDNNVRDLAATMLMVSDAELDQIDLGMLAGWMAEDGHYIVQYRLAVALFKRNWRYPEVVEMFEKARKDSDVGPNAEKIYHNADA